MGDSAARVHLRQLAVRSPCTVDWNGMSGGDAVRFCGTCKNNVHNLSAMSEADVERLLARSEDICVRYYYRADGTIVTSACPPSTRRRPGLAAVGVAGALAYTTAFAGISAAVSTPSSGDVATRDEGIKVAMGMKLTIRTPKPRTPAERMMNARGGAISDAPPSLLPPEAGNGTAMSAMPSQTIARASHTRLIAVLLAFGLFLVGLLLLALRVVTPALATSASRRL